MISWSRLELGRGLDDSRDVRRRMLRVELEHGPLTYNGTKYEHEAWQGHDYTT